VRGAIGAGLDRDDGRMLIVRDGSPSDLVALTEIHYEITRRAYRGLFPPDRDPPSYEDLLQDWTQTLADPGAEVLVAEAEEIVGNLVLRSHRNDERFGELKRVHVRPAWWRQGVGRSLFEVLARARRRGISQLHLWVIDGNERARRFFEARGWRLVPGVSEYHAGEGITEVQYRLQV
jgi:GNAT superfamily N-acetyltransferase